MIENEIDVKILKIGWIVKDNKKKTIVTAKITFNGVVNDPESEIQQAIDDAEKWRITRRSGDSSVLIPCETLDELKEKAEKYDEINSPETVKKVIENQQQQIKQLQEEKEDLKEEFESVQNLSDNVVELMLDRNTELKHLKEKLELLQTECENLNDECADLQKERKKLQQQIKQLQEEKKGADDVIETISEGYQTLKQENKELKDILAKIKSLEYNFRNYYEDDKYEKFVDRLDQIMEEIK